MREPLHVAACQPPLVVGDIAANAAAHAAAVRAAAGAAVVLFPELSLSAYDLSAPPLDTTDARLAPLVAACAETGALALAGATVAGSGGNSLGMLVVHGTGATVAYRKVWLGDTEEPDFVPGGRPEALTVAGWRLGLAMCKDLNTPAHAADTAALGIDVYLAGTVKRPDEAEMQAERARAVAREHGVWVVVASHAGPAGTEEFAQTPGGSSVWAPGGALVTQAGPDPGDAVYATLK